MLGGMVWSGIALVMAAPGGADTGWQWPLRPAPAVLRRFDPPAHPWEAGHRGVDLAAPPGRPVFAAGAGRVAFAHDLAGRGVVTITHGALRTTYLPVRPAVLPGQIVAAGARIGVVEGVLGHCGQVSCLHWGLLRGGSYLDPLSLLGLGPVRLLPWWHAPPPAAAPWPRSLPRAGADPGGRGPMSAIHSPTTARPSGEPGKTRPTAPVPPTRRAVPAPATRPVSATTGIGASVGPITVAGAAAVALSRLLAHRRRRSPPRRDR
ncbi:peptidoglycan DD-metalloendopeptidase family protein [Actinoallomurus sp. CA-150999]|uniref:M23 family metallopeptidase n=1 Tax=Actinoallomurus sp. CA-150999 TaxID=3239887 RepID=UPI003D900825